MMRIMTAFGAAALLFVCSCSNPSPVPEETTSIACHSCGTAVVCRSYRDGAFYVTPALCPHCDSNFQPLAITGEYVRIESEMDEEIPTTKSTLSSEAAPSAAPSER